MPSTETETIVTETVTPERIADIRAHAAGCGRLDCGHLGRSDSLAVRRAVILYTAEGMGLEVALDDESAEVAAVVGVLRESEHFRPTYTRRAGRYVRVAPGTTAMPNPWESQTREGAPFKLTPERREVFALMLAGHGATAIGSYTLSDGSVRPGLTSRTMETVKSHAGYLRRETGAHDATSALLALVCAGRLSDRAVTVPDDMVIEQPAAPDSLV